MTTQLVMLISTYTTTTIAATESIAAKPTMEQKPFADNSTDTITSSAPNSDNAITTTNNTDTISSCSTNTALFTKKPTIPSNLTGNNYIAILMTSIRLPLLNQAPSLLPLIAPPPTATTRHSYNTLPPLHFHYDHHLEHKNNK